MKRILICATLISTIKAFLIPHIELLKTLGYEIDLAGNKNTDELDRIVSNVYDIPFQRTPFSKQNFEAGKRLKEIAHSKDYNIIHFHTPVASAYGRFYVRKLRKTGTKIYYTAHGLHFFKGAPFMNWLIYFPVEYISSFYTDLLITINQEDYKRAQKYMHCNVEYTPGVGLDVDKFKKIEINISQKRTELNIPIDAFILLSIGELNKNKNHKIVIEALHKITNKNFYYIICGQGEEKEHLITLITSYHLQDHIKLLGQRNDIGEICKACDVFVFPSLREGLGIASLEAMACGLPIITSNVHGIVDYSKNSITGYTFNPKEVKEVEKCILEMFNDLKDNPNKYEKNMEFCKQYSFDNVIEIIKDYYC